MKLDQEKQNFTACISSIYYDQEQWKIHKYNKIDHLQTDSQ